MNNRIWGLKNYDYIAWFHLQGGRKIQNENIYLQRDLYPHPTLHECKAALVSTDIPVKECREWVRIPIVTYICFIKFRYLPVPNSSAEPMINEIKHDHSPVVIVVLDPRYD